MNQAKDFLKMLFDSIPFEKGNAYSLLRSTWKEVVGEDIAAYSEVEDLVSTKLVVKVFHPGIKQLLQLKYRGVLSSLQQKYPELEIKSIQFRLAPRGMPSSVGKSAMPVKKEIPEEKDDGIRFDEVPEGELKEQFSRLREALEKKFDNGKDSQS